MPDEELEKENKELKEQIETLTKERDELKVKVEEKGEPEENPDDKPDKKPDKKPVKKEVKNDDPEPMTVTKEYVDSIRKELKEELIKELTENKDDLLKALGFEKLEPQMSRESLQGLLKESEDGTSSLDMKKLYEMTKQGEEEYRNSDIESIPDVDTQLKELYE